MSTAAARGPGRPPRERSAAGLSVDEAQREGIVMGDDRDPNVAVEQSRIRIPMNSGQKLSLRGYKLDESEFAYKWFHEEQTRSGRIQDALNAFYEHCTLPDGSMLTANSGSGTMYLMRLPRQYWNQDVKASKDKRMALRKREAQLKDGEYTVDKYGRAVDSGEVIVSRKTSDNPYA
jgi:V8-like Glu-specific endopeptidase